eukprot:scaffold222477_cov22-Tisochrysis_lutea.AAC.1
MGTGEQILRLREGSFKAHVSHGAVANLYTYCTMGHRNSLWCLEETFEVHIARGAIVDLFALYNRT